MPRCCPGGSLGAEQNCRKQLEALRSSSPSDGRTTGGTNRHFWDLPLPAPTPPMRQDKALLDLVQASSLNVVSGDMF